MPDERHWPVAGGGSVVHHEPHDHGDGRRTMACSHFGPGGRFLGIMQMDLTPTRFSPPPFSPAAQIAASLALVRRLGRPSWATYNPNTWRNAMAEQDSKTTVLVGIAGALLSTANRAAERAADAADDDQPAVAQQWSEAARAALEGMQHAKDAQPPPSSSAVEQGLRHANRTMDDFLVHLAERFEGADTETSRRVAAEIRGVLDGVRDGAPA